MCRKLLGQFNLKKSSFFSSSSWRCKVKEETCWRCSWWTESTITSKLSARASNGPARPGDTLFFHDTTSQNIQEKTCRLQSFTGTFRLFVFNFLLLFSLRLLVIQAEGTEKVGFDWPNFSFWRLQSSGTVVFWIYSWRKSSFNKGSEDKTQQNMFGSKRTGGGD